jgi:carbonic anhydrase
LWADRSTLAAEEMMCEQQTGALSRRDLVRAIEENVRHQAELLAEASPVIAGLVKAGKVTVAGGVYDLSSGRVTPVMV